MTKDFETVKQNMTREGAWLLNDASETVKAYVKKNLPERYEEEIEKYKTPQKYIKRGDKIIVVSITQEIWAGIEIFDMREIIFREVDGVITVMKDKGQSKKIVSAADKFVDEEFITKMVKTGYITREEYNKYSTINSHKELPLIKTIVV